MKKTMAILMALAMFATLAATAEEQTAETTAETGTVETEFVDEAEETALLEGQWVNVPEMQADIYLPEGWAVTEATETGFIAAESAIAEEVEEPAEGTEEANEETEVTTDSQTAQTAATLTLTLETLETDLLTYAEENFKEYTVEAVNMGDAIVITDVENDEMAVLFQYDAETVVRLVLSPASRTELTGQLLDIAATFNIYQTEAEA